jgi:hypothetical protein
MHLADCYGGHAAGVKASLAPTMARLYAGARSGGVHATPHPPVGVASGNPTVDDALTPPCATHGDTACHTALATPPPPAAVAVTAVEEVLS